VDADRAAAIVATGLEGGGGWLSPAQVEALLGCYGLSTAPSRVASSARGAVRAAGRLGGPVAVKALAPGLLRKSAAGAVRLGVSGPTAVERAAREVLAAAREHGHAPDGVLVQRMAGAGTELLAGVVADPRLGPLVALAAGGAMAELLGDVEVRLAPVGPRAAGEMVAGLRSHPLLDGFGGRPRADVAALEEAVVRIGALAAAHPAVAELDCDPLVAGPGGAVVVDARVRVEPPPAPRRYASLGR
jgi:acetate---CoA ligase (ADP-forming)